MKLTKTIETLQDPNGYAQALQITCDVEKDECQVIKIVAVHMKDNREISTVDMTQIYRDLADVSFDMFAYYEESINWHEMRADELYELKYPSNQ